MSDADLAREGVARSVRSAGVKVRSWTPPALLAVLSAAAFAPLLVSGLGVSALVSAGVGAATAVGGNVLTDVVRGAVDSLRGREPTREEAQEELERRFREVLAAGDATAERLRAELAGVLRELGLVGTAIEAAVQSGDRELQVALEEGLAGLGTEFAEFSFVLTDLASQLMRIREGIDQQRAELQTAVGLQYRQATDTRLLLDRLALIERRIPAGDASDGARWRGGSPYKGLATYSEADADVFVGREEMTAQLVSTLSQRLTRPGLLIVTGASGAGKSSLLRAGLSPAIARGGLSEPARLWPRHVMDQPTRAPLTNLAGLLAGLAGLDARTVLDRLEGDPADASLLVRQAVDHDARRRELPAGGRLILVVDQFEEVFATGGEDAAAQRTAFVAALHAAATADPPAALVIIAVRGDVIDRCADHPELVEALRQGPFILGPMSEPELRSAITVPAETAGLEIESGLVDTILGELRTPTGFDAGALPLLSQTMLTVWEHREGNRLTNRGYAITGGVTRAVASSAEAAYAELDDERKNLARRLFQQLTAVSPDGRLTRRTMPRTALAEIGELEEVLEVFARRRLIVVDSDAVQISHDSLLTNWPALREWMEPDVTGQAIRSRLIDEAERWNREERATSYLYRGVELAAARQAEPRWRDTPLTGTAREFLDESVRAEARGTRRRRLTLATLSGLIAAALVLAGLAVLQSQTARQQEKIATARELVAKAEAALETDPQTALRLNVAAQRINPDPETNAYLQRAITTTPYAGQLTGVSTSVSSIAYSPSERYLAAGYVNGQVMLWDLRDPLRPRTLGRPFAAFDSPVNTIGFSSGDRRLVTAGNAGFIAVWDLTDPSRPRPAGNPVKGKKYRTSTVAISRDGSALAMTTEKNRELQLWDLTDPTRVRPSGPAFASQSKGLILVAFSSDGGRIAVAPSDYRDPVTLWDIRQRSEPRLLGRFEPRLAAGGLSFSGDGRMLAIHGGFKGTTLWDVSDPRNIRPASEPVGPAFTSQVSFAPKGTILAVTGDRDSGVVLWDFRNPDSPDQVDSLIAGEYDTAMAFSPDGRMAVSGASDTGRITLWNLARLGRPQSYGPPFVGHHGKHLDVYALDMSRDGTMLATGGRDNTVGLWNIADRARPRRLGTLKGHTGDGVEGLAFSPDGKLLSSGDTEGTVILWDLTDPSHPRPLGSPIPTPIDTVRALSFSADGKTLIAGGDSGTISWDLREPARPRSSARLLYEGGVLEIWRPSDGRVLALLKGTRSPRARDANPAPQGSRLWDISDLDKPKQLGPALTGHTDSVQSAALSPSGDVLAIGDKRGTVLLWDLREPSRPRRLGDALRPHGDSIKVALAFAPKTDLMVTSGSSGDVYLWDLGNRILPRRLSTSLNDNLDAVFHLAFSSDGGTLATAGSDGDVVLWDMRPTYDLRRHLKETSCLVTRGGLDREQWNRYLPDLDYLDTCAR
ncbi:nSTAND1 domain-containing NTPase [Actinomadura rudentiformis]|uniref:AAA family ATPase n=1 Tax=Actinomadura rudentiformis TaxID=359158 RepID=A0A6H9YM41_9ACTN|nr:AAA family ATPase [Actinomadura rudentiformis]KAB2348460.1 AAA family ATPase [Actinomadura rudentiformis]